MYLDEVMFLITFVLGYLLGSIPFGVLVAKAHGVCIFDVGSGNPGATNVLRSVGKKAGYAVFILDAIKGMLAVSLGALWNAPYLALLGALLGHSYSCWIHFKGGKGVATLIGGLFLLMPLPLISGLLVWLVIFKLLRYVSVASICFVMSLLPLCCIFYGLEAARYHALPLFILTILVILRHKANLIRLWRGEENRF